MKRIYLRAVGSEAEKVLDELLLRVYKAFRIDTAVLPTVDIPPGSYNPQRGQYLSTALFDAVEIDLPPDTLRVLGVTTVDLHVPQLSFVFGEAKLGGPSAVISTRRLYPEFYGRPHDHELFLKRMETEAVHELGHTFGLKHCSNPDCAMYFSNSIEESDRKGPEFCTECSRKINRELQRQTAGFTRSGGLS